VIRRPATLIFALLLAACGPRQTTPADVTPDPASTTTTQGRFAASFTIDRVTVRPGDEVRGSATLSLLTPGGATITGSSDLFAFEFTEVGGEGRHVIPVRVSDCGTQLVTSTAPIVTQILKSGAVVDGPNADWYRQFLQDPVVHLPKGEWDVTASAMFFDGQACTGQNLDMRATIRVHVIE
jgi:hypothetical protein